MEYIIQKLNMSHITNSIIDELGEEFLEYLNISGWSTYEDINGNLICIIDDKKCLSASSEILNSLVKNKNNLFFIDLKNFYHEDRIYLFKIKNYFGKSFGTMDEYKNNMIIFKLNCNRIEMLNTLFSSGFYHTSYAILEEDKN